MYNKITSYSVYHLNNLIRCGKQMQKGGKQRYDITIYEKEKENRKQRSDDKGWENGYHYKKTAGRWLKINRKRAISIKEHFEGKNLRFKLLEKFINI